MEKKITLVVVDFQYDFCLLGAPLYVPGSDRALWNISHLIENKKIGEVIFTADWHPANHCSFKRNGEIREYCRGRIRCAFGIGTNLTNDTGHKPSNIVMKLTSCQMNKNQPVFNCVKLSDDLGKHTGQEQEVEHCLNELCI